MEGTSGGSYAAARPERERERGGRGSERHSRFWRRKPINLGPHPINNLSAVARADITTSIGPHCKQSHGGLGEEQGPKPEQTARALCGRKHSAPIQLSACRSANPFIPTTTGKKRKNAEKKKNQQIPPATGLLCRRNSIRFSKAVAGNKQGLLRPDSPVQYAH